LFGPLKFSDMFFAIYKAAKKGAQKGEFISGKNTTK
jgi:hypothetical protein